MRSQQNSRLKIAAVNMNPKENFFLLIQMM